MYFYRMQNFTSWRNVMYCSYKALSISVICKFYLLLSVPEDQASPPAALWQLFSRAASRRLLVILPFPFLPVPRRDAPESGVLLSGPDWGIAPAGTAGWGRGSEPFFLFLYFLKIKISKIYVCFEIFQNYPRSPYGGRQALSVIFFFKFATRSLAKKMQGGLSPPQRATGACRPQWRQGPPSLYKHWLSFPCHLSLKIQKKKEGWREEKRRSSAEFRTCDLLVTSVWIYWYCITI